MKIEKNLDILNENLDIRQNYRQAVFCDCNGVQIHNHLVSKQIWLNGQFNYFDKFGYSSQFG